MRAFGLNRRGVTAGLLAGAMTLSITIAAGSASAAALGPHAIPNSLPNWTAKATVTGAPAPATKISFGVLLPMRDQAAAQALVQSLSTPENASYRKFLTNAQFKAQFAPAATDVSAVSSWLTTQGFTVDKVLSSGMYVEATGTAAQVQKTFASPLQTFAYKGKVVRANTKALTLPANTPPAVVHAIKGVLGIDQGAQLHQPADTLPGPAPGTRYGVKPCSAYYGQKIATSLPSAYGKKVPYAVCGYSGKQLQGAYGVTPLLKAGITGQGATVAITDAYASPTILKDANTYSARHGLPQFTAGQFAQITPPANGYSLTGPPPAGCDAQGWYGEETLDVEAVHTMAPGAKIVYVGAADCLSGLDDAWAESIDNHVADVLTNSWGDGVDTIADLGQDYVDFYVQFSIEAALTGITVTFSTGDDGDQTAGGTTPATRSLSFPSDLPLVTAVGGTSIAINKQNQWIGEAGWQNAYSTLTNGAWTPAPPGPYSSGGGGGSSQLFAQPFYQKGKVPARMSEYFGGPPARTTPDISMDGDPNTGLRVGQTQQFSNGTYYDEYRIGGTSVSSPLFAGVIAVADQLAGGSLGFANPLYYRLLRTPAVHDIVAPKAPVAEVRTDFTNLVDRSGGYLFRLRTVDVPTTIHAVKGYDDETGVGTPNGPLFFLGLLLAGGIHATATVPASSG